MKKIKTPLTSAKNKLASNFQKCRKVIAEFGQSSNTSMLLIATLPKNVNDDDLDMAIGQAGSPEAVAKAIIDKAKRDVAFRDFMIEVMYKVQHDIPDEGNAGASQELPSEGEDSKIRKLPNLKG